MKKFATLAMSAALALSLAACGGTPAVDERPAEDVQEEMAAEEAGTSEEATTSEEAAPKHEYAYTYEGIEFWDVAQDNFGGASMRDIMTTMAKPETDMDAYIGSPMGEFALGSMTLSGYGAIDAPEVAEYWANLGMVHEAHDVEDADHQWTSIVPDDLDESKTYPLLFVWHGNDNPILLAEGYGLGQAAAAKDWIVVFPWAANDDEYLAEFDRILAYMQENYPVDASRIYTTGFSKGGRVSAHLALERADVIAAAAPNGTTASASFYNPDDSALGLTGPQELTAEDFANAKGFVPIQFWGGEYDVFGAMPYDADYKIAGVNGWLGLMGNENMQELGKAGDSATEQAIGLVFDKVEEIEEDGTTYHVGSYVDANDDATFRIVECDGAIHWPTSYMGEMAVDFLEQFSK